MTNSAATTTLQMGGGPGLPAKTLVLDCENRPDPPPPPKTRKCDQQQICAKLEKVNDLAQQGKLRRPKRSKRQKKRARKRGNTAADTFKSRLGNQLLGKGNRGRILKTGPKKPDDLKPKFMHDCAHEEWKNDGADPAMQNLSADHVHEIQLGGAIASRNNFLMMSSGANEWVGTCLKSYKPEDGYNSVTGNCCPA